MTSDNGRKWPSRDGLDMIRSIEESIPRPTVCLVKVVDGQLMYERVGIGSNGNISPKTGGEEVEKASVREPVLVAVGEKISP